MPWTTGGSDGKGPWGAGPKNDSNLSGPRRIHPWGGCAGGPNPAPGSGGGGWLPPGGWPMWLQRGRGGGPALPAIAVFCLALLWVLSGFFRVQPDQQGVVLRFGAFVRVAPPGLGYHLPWPIETVDRPAVTRISRIEIGTDGDADSQMLTGDENIIDIHAAIFWRIRDVSAYLFATRNPAASVKSAAESVMREVLGRTKIQPALTEARARIERDVTAGTQKILDEYGTGIEVTQVQLLRVDPPQAVIESFRDVQRANTDADRARNEAEAYANDIVPRARGDAAHIVADADAARQASIASANGQAARFLSVWRAYRAAPKITLSRLYIETMQDVMQHADVTVIDHTAQPALPLLSLNGRHDAAADTAANAAPAPATGERGSK